MVLLLKRHFSNSLAYYRLKNNYEDKLPAIMNPSEETIFSAHHHLCTFLPLCISWNYHNLDLNCSPKMHVFSVAILEVVGPKGRSLLVTGNMLLNGIVGWTTWSFFFLSFLSQPSYKPCHMFPTWCAVPTRGPRAMRLTDHRLKFPKLWGQINFTFL